MTSAAPDGTSDAGLVRSALGGDVASFSALLVRFLGSGHSYAEIAQLHGVLIRFEI